MRLQHYVTHGGKRHLESSNSGYCLRVWGESNEENQWKRDDLYISAHGIPIFIYLFSYFLLLVLLYLGWGFCLAGANPAMLFAKKRSLSTQQ